MKKDTEDIFMPMELVTELNVMAEDAAPHTKEILDQAAGYIGKWHDLLSLLAQKTDAIEERMDRCPATSLSEYNRLNTMLSTYRDCRTMVRSLIEKKF